MNAKNAARDTKSNRRARAARRGWTLVEALVVISLSAGVIGLATTMLVGVFRASGQGLDLVASRGVISRLAEQFRADVAAAQECQPIESEPGAAGERKSGIALLVSDKNRVEYLALAQVLERIAYQGDRVERRETYHLGQQQTARLTISPELPTVVRCSLHADEGHPGTARRMDQPITIVATLGRDQRYQRSAPDAAANPPVEQPPEPAESKPAPLEAP